ncbi:MAG: hypothetical protein ABJP45_12130 [Cyclobacteriaceae bacterium]
MAKKKVIWTTTAATQRNSILKYWVKNNKSSSYSLKLLKLSNQKTEITAKNPELYKLSDHPDTKVASMGHSNLSVRFYIHMIQKLN